MDGERTQAAVTEATVRAWAAAFIEVEQQLGPHCARAEARQQATAYLRGLLSPVARKHSWHLADVAGAVTPYGFQHLLGRAMWDADAVRAALQSYVAEQLGDPEAVVVLDETGVLKNGRRSAGVARQDSGTAGRIANAQIGVGVTYASRHGHTLLDRDLDLPKA